MCELSDMKGLTTDFALQELINELRELLAGCEMNKCQWKFLARNSLSVNNEHSLFPWSSIVCSASYVLFMLTCGILEADLWLILEAVVVLVLLLFNVALNSYDHYLAAIEMPRRLGDVIGKLEKHRNAGIRWAPENYPHLHTPLSASVVLQWAIRDGNKVNLPWALLVEDDLIYLKPGQVAPGRCHSVNDTAMVVNKGDVLHLQTDGEPHHTQDHVSPIPEFKPSVQPQLFRLEETPYIGAVRPVLDRQQLDRPSSRLTKYQHLFFVQLLCQCLAPFGFLATLICSIIRYSHGWYDGNTVGLFGVAPIVVALPMVSLSFPLCWSVANYVALAKVMNDYWSFRHVHVTEDPFDDGNQQPHLILEQATQAANVSSLRASFISAILGRGEYLSRTENLIHALGSITALCSTDKKGILSWPNTSAEKIFILKHQEPQQRMPMMPSGGGGGGGGGDIMSVKSDNIIDEKRPSSPAAGQTSTAESKHRQITTEILTITHDHRNPFKVEFDDPAWREYIEHLKPLGLSILLNTCNISTEEKYTNFFNHLVCESMRVDEDYDDHATGDQTSNADVKLKVDGDKLGGHRGDIELLPIVTRGCLCELAKKIGFEPGTVEKSYALTNQIQTFRHIRRSSADAGANSKFIRNLHLARLKFPFPHMVSVLMHQRAFTAGESHHLISQGTADLILDSCVDAWAGKDLEPLTEDVRKKVLDFYQRASLSSYCTAFSYRPMVMPLPWTSIGEYLQLPSHSLPFYWQNSGNAASAEADAVQNLGHISLGPNPEFKEFEQKDESHVKTRDDAMACLELECNQSFLGMVQLQYQALVDIVQLIDLLEKACIRFVHFSKENELRSRVFSEKMGLESGWNCHVSLKSNEANMRRTVSYCCPRSSTGRRKRSGKRVAVPATTLWSNRYTIVGSSLPDKLDRHQWFLDFPRWHETRRGGNGDRRESRTFASISQPRSSDLHSAPLETLPEELYGRTASRQASVTSDSDPFDYDMSNRAQLPKGIENIRPHLETMDNVPLLVSLFTDCTPETTREMIEIMQDYGEVVCVMGSAANHHNMATFLQADASLAIEPLYPQVCQNVPVYQPTRSCTSPTQLSQLLISVASSITYNMEDEVSIFHLILESRHLNLCLFNAMQFWTSSLVFILVAQLSSQAFALPLLLTAGQTLWLTLFAIPLISLSLVGPKQPDKDVMNISTGKNQVIVDGSSIQHALWCYGFRFLPTAALLVLAHGLASLEEVCNDHLNMVAVSIYLVCISLSFLFRARHLWQRHPGHNRLWVKSVLLLVVVQAIYTSATVICGPSFPLPSESAWIMWVGGLPLVVALNEAVKRYEIKGEVRYQKRQRLEFGTKLGINSPF